MMASVFYQLSHFSEMRELVLLGWDPRDQASPKTFLCELSEDTNTAKKNRYYTLIPALIPCGEKVRTRRKMLDFSSRMNHSFNYLNNRAFIQTIYVQVRVKGLAIVQGGFISVRCKQNLPLRWRLQVGEAPSRNSHNLHGKVHQAKGGTVQKSQLHLYVMKNLFFINNTN